MNNYEHILSPFTIKSVKFKNHIELAPMCYMLPTFDGLVTREMIAYYQDLARGGAGIITIGESPIDHEYAQDHEFMLNLGSNKVINGLSNLVEAVEKFGAVLSIETNHCGRFKLNGTEAIAPSPIPSDLEEELARAAGRPPAPVKEMDLPMIDHVIRNWADAIERCKKAGMRMAMIHAGHGHLIAQFLSPYSNHRTDSYGGNLENRAKFCIRLLDAVRARVGNDFVLEMRISANELVKGGMVEEDVIEFVKLIKDKIDILHVSAGLLGNNRTVPEMIQPTYWPHCYNVHRAARLKKEFPDMMISTVGSIPDMETAESIVAEGKADIVTMGRAILVDHQIVNKARHGKSEDIRPCMRCFECNKKTRDFYPIRCAGNPIVGREIDYAEIRPALKSKKVVIVGGGPAGMQTALTASERGHVVVLFEKQSELGGNLRYAAASPLKGDLKKFTEWMIRQTEKAPNVTLKLGTEATRELVAAENPDAIVVAVGAAPILPKNNGFDRENVIWVGDADSGAKKVGQNVVVVGAGTTGAETALQLSKEGKNVTLVEIQSYAKGVKPQYPRGLAYLIEEAENIDIVDETKVEEITDEGVVLIDKQWKRRTVLADTVILSLGFVSRSNEAENYKRVTSDIYEIGDCLKVTDIYHAVHNGFDTAMEL